MNFIIFIFALFLLPIVQVANAQSLTDSINNAVENNIGNTFDSINQAANNTSNGGSENSNDSQTTTTSSSGPGNSHSTTTTMKTNNQ